MSNIAFRTLINALYLSHFSSWATSPYIWKQIYYFLFVVSVDDRGVVVVVIVSPKEEERNFFEVSHVNVNHNYFWHQYYHDGWFFDLIRWYYIICTRRVIWINLALGLYRSINTCWYDDNSVWVSVFIQLSVTVWMGWRFWRCICDVFKSLSVFYVLLILANSVGRSLRAMIYCSRFWNYEILLKISKLWDFKILNILVDIIIYFFRFNPIT